MIDTAKIRDNLSDHNFDAQNPLDIRDWALEYADQIDRLRAALKRYGRHDDGCRASPWEESPSPPRCTCGFDEACK